MYTSNTILELKEKRSKGEPGTPEYEPFAYDEVKVIGSSPIENGGGKYDYEGADAQGVIIQPLTSFESTIDEPFGKLRAIYDVKELPVVEVEEPKVRVIDAQTAEAGPTPEEVFADEAPGEASVDGRRVRTSPLPDPPNAKKDGPLGAPPSEVEGQEA